MSKNRMWLSHGMLYEFKGWLVMNGWKLEKPVGKYEVLRARHYLKERPLLVYNRTSGGCGYSIDMRDKDVFEEYHEYRENLGKPSIHAVPQLMETYERDVKEDPVVIFECARAYSVPLVDEDEFMIDGEYLDIEPGTLWEFDLRDILQDVLSISEVRLTAQDGKWIQITWKCLWEYFRGVGVK